MNERIQELIQQAMVKSADMSQPDRKELDPEKFAELIVRDCKNVIRQEWFDENNTEPEQDARSIAIHVGKKVGLDSALNAVSKHFGVKE